MKANKRIIHSAIKKNNELRQYATRAYSYIISLNVIL